MKIKPVILILALFVMLTPFTSAFSAEIAPDFTMVGTWTAEYNSQKVTILLKDNNEGILTVDSSEPVNILKWDVELGKKGKINIGLYFYSKDKGRFVKRTLKMYNAGKGLKLKAIYQTKNKLKLYNALSVKDGKIQLDDGRMELNR